jgi:hypothetical protein
MSRRARRRAEDSRREARPRATGDDAPEPQPARRGTSLPAQLALLAAVFALAVLVAELFGAANLGVAFGVGQIAFAIALVYLLVRR